MAQTLRERLAAVVQADIQAADLRSEIATLRALADYLLDRPEAKFDVEGFLKVLERLIRAVDVQQRAQREGMVSLATIERYVEALGLVIAKHVKDHDVLARIEADARAIPLLTG